MTGKPIGLASLFVFALMGCFRTQAQGSIEKAPYYQWFDALVSPENTALYEGLLFKEQYRTINQNTRYFRSPDFIEGYVVYGGQPYVAQQLKYDVFGDQLLLKVQDRLGGNTLQLFRDRVSEFGIDGHRFLHVPAAADHPGISGFYEVSLENPAFTLLTKHRKKDFDRKDRSSLYYEFLDAKKEHVLWYGNAYHSLERRNDVTALFPDLEEQIDDFYNRARVLRRTNPHGFMLGLMQRLATLLPQDTRNTFR